MPTRNVFSILVVFGLRKDIPGTGNYTWTFNLMGYIPLRPLVANPLIGFFVAKKLNTNPLIGMFSCLAGPFLGHKLVNGIPIFCEQ